ncbi:MAG: hypothetical protein A2W35_21535 [Chloroflexi bacterium RBG_16_57_11]|nr:MAG: hypothetical protein A2W35_21535 [Chloroflexi bacterium RBG_16_57_11]
MMRLRNSIYLLLIVALIAAPLAFISKPAAAQETYNCLPTCEENDARFLSVAGVGLSTVADQPITLTFGVPASSASVEIGIFDGDTGGQWDYLTTPLNFILYADPILSGSTSNIVAQRSGTIMPDNAWSTFDFTNVPEALSPSGNYFYRLVISPATSGMIYLSNFKVRTNATVMLAAQPFSYLAPMLSPADRAVVYPSYPNLTPTTYDGRFNFHFFAPGSMPSLAAWDGDFDFGPFDLSAMDTDDPDTPNNALPPWVNPATTNFEGVADGRGDATGAPPDDSEVPEDRRQPNVVYDVVLPDGTTYTNQNPSGNIEWEQFLLSSDPASQPDHLIQGTLPSGVYSIRARGVDLNNLNAWKFPFQIVGVCAAPIPGGDANPCVPPLFPFSIGDKVFRDTDGDGVQDPGEEGIPGVVVYLLDGNGQPISDINGNPISAITDANGTYTFNVPAGTFSVRVGSENFDSGGPLAGNTSTTGGEVLTRTVVDTNVLTYDFGYRVPPTPPTPFLIGDKVFRDTNGNGVQDLGEPGIPGVVVYLLDANGNPISDVNGNTSAVTDATGTYSFSVLPGTYSVRVGVENFNLGGPLAGATSTTGGEVLTRTVTDEDVLTFDFGYRFPPTVCVVTPGIWKTTYKNRWPVESITVAGVTYTREQAILIMSTSPKYDMTYQLFAQVVAAKLNILAGNPSSCIDAAIETAETWLMTYPLGSGVVLYSPAWRSIMYIFKDLDNYNKGRLCAEACVITPIPPPTKPPKPVKVEPVSGR